MLEYCISVLIGNRGFSELVRDFSVSLYGAILMHLDAISQAMSKMLQVGKFCIVTATQIQILEL